MLQQLIEMFAGKPVRITHTNKAISPVEGVCKTVRQSLEETDDYFYIVVLEDDHLLWFVPEVVTATSVDGPLRALAGGRRKIEVVPNSDKSDDEFEGAFDSFD